MATMRWLRSRHARIDSGAMELAAAGNHASLLEYLVSIGTPWNNKTAAILAKGALPLHCSGLCSMAVPWGRGLARSRT